MSTNQHNFIPTSLNHIDQIFEADTSPPSPSAGCQHFLEEDGPKDGNAQQGDEEESNGNAWAVHLSVTSPAVGCVTGFTITIAASITTTSVTITHTRMSITATRVSVAATRMAITATRVAITATGVTISGAAVAITSATVP